MNIIVVGCGKVGEKLVERLSAEKDNNVTVVDVKTAPLHSVVNNYDVMGVSGNGMILDTLIESGIKDADILIAVTICLPAF